MGRGGQCRGAGVACELRRSSDAPAARAPAARAPAVSNLQAANDGRDDGGGGRRHGGHHGHRHAPRGGQGLAGHAQGASTKSPDYRPAFMFAPRQAEPRFLQTTMRALGSLLVLVQVFRQVFLMPLQAGGGESITFLLLAAIKIPFPGAAAAKQGRELSTSRFRPLNLRVSARAITLR